MFRLFLPPLLTLAVTWNLVEGDSAASHLRSTRPLYAVSLPEVHSSTWDRNPIDTFIRAQQQDLGIRPNPPAPVPILLRRIHLDLIGLPPSPSVPDTPESNSSAKTYENWVDQLLASPAYGEHWGTKWLDVARFAESSGFEHDSDRPHAFPYRDFVIHALNTNLPFDTFAQWQIAGDQIEPDSPWAHAATGFLGAGVFPTQLTEREFESARYDELDDMVSTFGSAFLGLSIGCARCHDHKFDPIPSRDYYALAATFTRTIRTQIDLAFENGQTITAMVNSENKPPLEHAADGRGFPHFYDTTYFLQRGDINKKIEPVSPGFLSALKRPDSRLLPSGDRTKLARWLTNPANGAGHLVARVMVNRLWQHHFGTGLVDTPNDFGTQGNPPSHPELLDWLAFELIQRDWNLKAIQRLIVTSNTYRQSSDVNPNALRIDPSNRLLWRFTPRRLEAETIRDSMLAISGLLDETTYGPGSLDPNMRRRSIYFVIKRSELISFLLLFDFPERLVSIGKRATTNIPPQGLALMNSPVIRQYASGLAKRAQALAPPHSSTQVIHSLYRLAFHRLPTDQEHRLARAYLQHEQRKTLPFETSITDFAHTLLMSNEFLYLR